MRDPSDDSIRGKELHINHHQQIFAAAPIERGKRNGVPSPLGTVDNTRTVFRRQQIEFVLCFNNRPTRALVYPDLG